MLIKYNWGFETFIVKCERRLLKVHIYMLWVIHNNYVLNGQLKSSWHTEEILCTFELKVYLKRILKMTQFEIYL